MHNDVALTDAPLGGAFARIVGRLRLTQGEVGMMLGLDGRHQRVVQPVVDARNEKHVGCVLAALERAAALVGDDAILAAWLRTPQARRGGVTPMEEMAGARGDVPVRFVLDPHPTELVGVVAARSHVGTGGAPLRPLTARRPRPSEHAADVDARAVVEGG